MTYRLVLKEVVIELPRHNSDSRLSRADADAAAVDYLMYVLELYGVDDRIVISEIRAEDEEGAKMRRELPMEDILRDYNLGNSFTALGQTYRCCPKILKERISEAIGAPAESNWTRAPRSQPATRAAGTDEPDRPRPCSFDGREP